MFWTLYYEEPIFFEVSDVCVCVRVYKIWLFFWLNGFWRIFPFTCGSISPSLHTIQIFSYYFKTDKPKPSPQHMDQSSLWRAHQTQCFKCVHVAIILMDIWEAF